MSEHFPNPLRIGMGEGRMCVGEYRLPDARGLLFRDTGEPHEVGAEAPELPAPHEPAPGEVYLEFSNVESAIVVRNMMQQLVDGWEKPCS